MRRAIIIVLDSAGIGESPDAADFGDGGSNTIRHVYEANASFSLPNLEKLGLRHIEGTGLKPPDYPAQGAYGKMREASKGKDTTTGHWEMAGVRTDVAFPTFPNGFPDEIIREFSQKTGCGALCNKPYSGTDVIHDYWDAHFATSDPIVYTSADSVMQLAAHNDVIPLKRLYELCEIARGILDKYQVGRVIARPFVGKSKDDFTRTSDRRDFSMPPSGPTVMDAIVEAGKRTYAIGKIEDIFAAKGVSESVHITGNADGVDKTIQAMRQSKDSSLIFTNLVDFDSLYGHRNDPIGYGKALAEFDASLPDVISALDDGDLLILTADHGCDPTTPSTDHSREYVPLLVYAKGISPANLGIRKTFADIAATVAAYLGVSYSCPGESFLPLLGLRLEHGGGGISFG